MRKNLQYNLQNVPQPKFRKIHFWILHSTKYTFSLLRVQWRTKISRGKRCCSKQWFLVILSIGSCLRDRVGSC